MEASSAKPDPGGSAGLPGASLRQPSFREALQFWTKLGFINFGGPAGQIAIMHTEVVEKRRWVDERHFLDALNFCMLLPSPEAHKLAIYLGWLLHRTRGGLAAGILFVLPAAVLLWALSWLYVVWGNVTWIAAAFHGLQACVLAIIAAAMLRIGSRVLQHGFHWAVAICAGLALAEFQVPFPLVIATAALAGWVAGSLRPVWFVHANADAKTSNAATTIPASGPSAPTMFTSTVRTFLIYLAAWWGPLILAGAIFGWPSVWWQESAFFVQAALLTFGGAYAVLPYVALQSVNHFHWLTAPQMMNGLALAETTPGPLIIVLEFVGFVGAWNNPGALNPLLAGTLGAAVTVWATFAPSFLFVFVGAPHVEKMRSLKILRATLSAVTAAVVGVIFNLALWFGAQVLWPAARGFDLYAAIIAVLAFAALHWRRWSIARVVALGAIAGLLGHVAWGW